MFNFALSWSGEVSWKHLDPHGWIWQKLFRYSRQQTSSRTSRSVLDGDNYYLFWIIINFFNWHVLKLPFHSLTRWEVLTQLETSALWSNRKFFRSEKVSSRIYWFIYFFPACTINRNHSCTAPVIMFISLFGCGDPYVLPVCQQLTHRIEQLLSNKNTQYYMKSITCIQAFREQSVKVNKHSHCSSFGGANDDAVFAVGLAFLGLWALIRLWLCFFSWTHNYLLMCLYVD